MEELEQKMKDVEEMIELGNDFVFYVRTCVVIIWLPIILGFLAWIYSLIL